MFSIPQANDLIRLHSDWAFTAHTKPEKWLRTPPPRTEALPRGTMIRVDSLRASSTTGLHLNFVRFQIQGERTSYYNTTLEEFCKIPGNVRKEPAPMEEYRGYFLNTWTETYNGRTREYTTHEPRHRRYVSRHRSRQTGNALISYIRNSQRRWRDRDYGFTLIRVAKRDAQGRVNIWETEDDQALLLYNNLRSST